MRLRCLFLAAATAATLMVRAADPSWEKIDTRPADITRLADENRQVEITLGQGYVYVTLARPATVKVFTIVGQLVSQASLPAGTFRIKLNARGIYLLKAGSVTRRITI